VFSNIIYFWKASTLRNRQTKDLISTEFPKLPRIIDNFKKLIEGELSSGDDRYDLRFHTQVRQELFFNEIEYKHELEQSLRNLRERSHGRTCLSGEVLAKI